MRIRKSRRRNRAGFLCLISLSRRPSGSAWAITPPPIATGGVPLGLEPLSTVGAAPVDMQQPVENADRFFVANQGGQVRLIQGGVLQTTPFLNVAANVALNTNGTEV